jgi:hypothetical protein
MNGIEGRIEALVIVSLFVLMSAMGGCLIGGGGVHKTNGQDITISPPFDHVADLNMAVDGEDNVHFVWLRRSYRNQDTEVKYSKYDSSGDPLVTNKTITRGSMGYSGDQRIIPIEFDSDGNVHVLVDRSTRYQMDGINIGQDIHYIKIGNDGKVLINKVVPRDPKAPYSSGLTDSSAREPAMAIDSKDNLHLVWAVWDSINDESGHRTVRDIHYQRLDKYGEVLIPEIQLTKDSEGENEEPRIFVDEDDGVHVIWQQKIVGEDPEIWYAKIASDGSVLELDKEPTFVDVGYIEDASIHNGYLFVLWVMLDEHFKTRIDLTGNVEPSVKCDPDRPFSKEERKGLVLFHAKGFSCKGEDVTINITIYDGSGDLKASGTVLNLLKKAGYSHGPAIFSIMSEKDSEGNIHLSYYFSDGGSNFQAHHIVFDQNGDMIPPLHIIAPV